MRLLSRLKGRQQQRLRGQNRRGQDPGLEIRRTAQQEGISLPKKRRKEQAVKLLRW